MKSLTSARVCQRTRALRGLLLLLSVFALHGCAYLHTTFQQLSYWITQQTSPSQYNAKHMLEQKTHFVYGQIVDDANRYAGHTFLVAAVCSKYCPNEIVDSSFVAKAGTHFGLNLPSGDYEILVFADLDANASYGSSERLGYARIELEHHAESTQVVGATDIHLGDPQSLDWAFNFPAAPAGIRKQSLFFPKDTIRELSDPLFDSSTASLGLYEPAAFLERWPTMFYALEEDSYKIPVIFVHGIAGSARQFSSLIDRLDRQRYQPWFYHYASGTDLNQLATLFYDIFLSGRVNQRGEMPIIIIAHSMGGLIVREALNSYSAAEEENRPALLITLATPFAGHAAATSGVKHAPFVIPAWRDLDPTSPFIRELFRKPLADDLEHHLIYAESSSNSVHKRSQSDGVVPLSSQLRGEAVEQSNYQRGFKAGHSAILEDDGAITYILETISSVESIYPQSHLQLLSTGGYAVELDHRYSDREKFIIREAGKYLSALADGRLEPVAALGQQHFIQVARGQVRAVSEVEQVWSKFIEDYPEYGPGTNE